jgi:hypothetical protein
MKMAYEKRERPISLIEIQEENYYKRTDLSWLSLLLVVGFVGVDIRSLIIISS